MIGHTGDISSFSGENVQANIASPAVGNMFIGNGAFTLPSWSAAGVLNTSLTTPLVYGSSASNGDLTIEGTSNSTKTTAYVIINPTTGQLNLGPLNANSPATYFNLGQDITGGTTKAGMAFTGTIQSGVTATHRCMFTLPATQAAAFTLANLIHVDLFQGTFGAGSAVTTQTGFRVDATMIGAATNYGFYGNIPAGINRWNNYHAGTAQNYFAGITGIGVAVPLANLHSQSTTEQQRWSYDATHYWNATTASSGITTIDGGTGEGMVISMPLTIQTPFTLGATSVTTTGIQLNYLSSATGTTGTTSTNLVFSTSPSLVTPILGTPTSGTLTNCTGYTDANLSTSDITTNNASTTKHGFAPKYPNDATKYLDGTGSYTVPAIANLTGPITSVGSATSIAAQTGTGTTFAMETSPTFVTDITTPIIYGGLASGSNLTLRSQNSGMAGAGDYIEFSCGNGTNAIVRVDGVGNMGVGTIAPVANAKLAIKDGHLQSQQTTAPTVTANTGAITSALSNATDIAGAITITCSTTTGGTSTITFNKTFTTAPIVTLTATNAGGATNLAVTYVTSTTSTFVINMVTNTCSSGSAGTYNYHVIETQ